MDKKRLWTTEEDELLDKVVQDYVKRGKSKRMGFEAVARKIHRSPGTCSHRYYTRIHQPSNEMTMESCIAFLQRSFTGDGIAEKQLLMKEKAELLFKQNELKKKYAAYTEKHEKLKAMLNLLEKAEELDKGDSLPPVIH
ncbi:hypothetical protein HF072_13620 [Bacillus sp. RO3]|nr:hypothetical protein [Bacillus sp. RO3]